MVYLVLILCLISVYALEKSLKITFKCDPLGKNLDIKIDSLGEDDLIRSLWEHIVKGTNGIREECHD